MAIGDMPLTKRAHADAMRLSVIIPGYNTPFVWWQRVIKSVLSALGPNDEVICVDDGSKIPLDLKQLECGNDSRVRLITLKENCGQAEARNRGLSVAKGDYVTFVDSDDEIVFDVYRKCFEYLSKNDCDVVMFGMAGVWEDIKLARYSIPPVGCEGVLTASQVWEIEKVFLLEHPVNKIYRLDFLKRNGILFPTGVCPGEDTMFVLSCIRAKAVWGTVPIVGYVYYRPDGTTLSSYIPNLRNSIIFRNQKWQEYKDEVPDARAALGRFGEIDERGIVRAEWNNIWRRNSPWSLRDKWRFLGEHPELIRFGRWGEMMRKIVYTFFRIHFYLKVIRRWHTKRLFRDMREFRREWKEILPSCNLSGAGV